MRNLSGDVERMTKSTPAWAPLRRRAFRALWMAQFVANIGTWAQTVGAQWLMGDLGGGELQVALVQTASTLPVFLLVVPSGALGDILDRRKLLLAGQTLMLLAAGALALFTATGLTTPLWLLAMTAVLGVGQALSTPSFQAIQPELVAREQLPQAALLNGVNMNVARAVGPALGGALIAAIGTEATFAFNALSFLGVLVVLYAWPRPPDQRPLGAEHITSALRAGARYVRSSPAFARVLARSALFMVFASGLWALLPAVARTSLDMGAGGYGLLLGSVGVGAVSGAFVVSRLRDRWGANAVVTTAVLVYAVAMVVVGSTTSPAPAMVALVVAGLAWISVQSTLSATAQILLPAWTRARALAYYQLVFMGGQALGAVCWGAVAGGLGLPVAFVVPAGCLVVGTLATVRLLALPEARPDVSSALLWDEPPSLVGPDSDAGPVLVTVRWEVDPDDATAFIVAMRPVGRSRRRTGATLWGLFQDAEDPRSFVETFTVPTWHEHLRQHLERGTVADLEVEAAARALAVGTPRVEHSVWADRGLLGDDG
jgi:MFS family permease